MESFTPTGVPAVRTFIGTQPQYREGSQKDRILKLLLSKPYISLPEILPLFIASYTRIISSLKEDGYIIECQCKKVGIQKHSIYILHGYDESKKRVSHYVTDFSGD